METGKVIATSRNKPFNVSIRFNYSSIGSPGRRDSRKVNRRQPTNLHERSGLMQVATIAKKPRKQAISGRFWAGRTYMGRIKDDHKIDNACGNGLLCCS